MKHTTTKGIDEGHAPCFILKHFGLTAQNLLDFVQASYNNKVNPMPQVRKWAKGKDLSVCFSYKPIVWSTSCGDMVNVILQKGIAWLYCYSQETGFFHYENQNPRHRFLEPLFLGGDDCLIYDELGGQWIGHNRNYLKHVHGGSFTPQLLELFDYAWKEDGDTEFNQGLQLWVTKFTQNPPGEGWVKYNLRIISNQRQVLAFDSYKQTELKETRNKAYSHYSLFPERGDLLEKYLERVADYQIVDGIFVPSYK